MDEAELARERGASLLEALEAEMPTATARSEIAATLATAIATELGSPDAALIGEAARLQEVGKIYDPEAHFEHGNALARGAGVPDRACAWILNARERWDGGGATGLAGSDIPLGSRVIAVCREYLDAPLGPDSNGADPRTVALERLHELGGNVLDPELAGIAAELAAPASDLVVRDREDADRDAVRKFLRERHAVPAVARNGELVEPLEHPMLLADLRGELAGVLTWIDDGERVEILTLHASEPRQGIGTALVEELAARCGLLARAALVVTTTNDNVDALRFLQRRGFRLRALRAGAVEDSRARLKPSIPAQGDHGIYLRDELELERDL